MILFDYGDTLAWEPMPDFLRGWQAAFQYIAGRPEGIGPEHAKELADSLWQHFSGSRSLSASRKGGWEIHEWQQLRTVFGALGLEFSLSLPEVEIVLMDNACQSFPNSGAEEMLGVLRRQGIRTGVVSNIGWSGQALAHRLNKLFPSHHFEFILASSEYGIRKPDPLLFRIALKKAGLPAEKVWFCGDNLQADVCGAHGAGIFPVWYRDGEKEGPEFPYLAVSEWQEMVDVLAGLE